MSSLRSSISLALLAMSPIVQAAVFIPTANSQANGGRNRNGRTRTNIIVIVVLVTVALIAGIAAILLRRRRARRAQSSHVAHLPQTHSQAFFTLLLSDTVYLLYTLLFDSSMAAP